MTYNNGWFLFDNNIRLIDYTTEWNITQHIWFEWELHKTPMAIMNIMLYGYIKIKMSYLCKLYSWLMDLKNYN